MTTPVPVRTEVKDETFGGVHYHISGELVPVLQVEVGSTSVFFEHHILLWKQPSVDIAVKAMPGMGKRLMAGIPVFVTEARGSGSIAFSRDGAGQIIPIHLKSGQSVDVREHQWLAATAGVGYSFKRVKGVASMLFGGSGFFIDTFSGADADGVLWLHGYGNVFETTLGAGEQIDVEPGGWVYKDSGVKMETITQKFGTGLFASAGQGFFNRFTGPGRLGIQSMYIHFESTD
jgi:uncharacterized protein (AIM24 family)